MDLPCIPRMSPRDKFDPQRRVQYLQFVRAGERVLWQRRGKCPLIIVVRRRWLLALRLR